MLIAQITDLHVSEPGSLIGAVVDANAMLAAAVRFLDDLEPASFLPPEHVIDLPAVVPNWDEARDFLLARGPMPKTGSVLG